jgi:phytoene desaturase
MGSGKKILIAGGGVGGLVAGIYAQKAGYETMIYEKNTYAGGECTGWDRQGYHIDGCINWLIGTKEGREMNRLWQQTGALKNTEIYQPESFITVMDKTGSLSIWRDREKLKNHLLEIAPEDKHEIEKMLQIIASFEAFEPAVDKPMELMNLFGKSRFLIRNRKVFGKIGKYSRITVGEYKERFRNPLIRTALSQLVPDEFSAHNLFFTLAAFTSDNAGIPSGGSKAFSERLLAKYRMLLGEITYDAEVEEIIINDGKAVGITLSNGASFYGDYIVTACDPSLVFNKMLKGLFIDLEFMKRYGDGETYPLHTGIHAAFAVDGPMSAFPGTLVFDVDRLIFEGKVIDKLLMRHFNHEPSFSPEGKSLIIVYIDASYDWWKKLYENPGHYRLEKGRLAGDIAARIEKRFPLLQGKLHALDVATPLTYERYCGTFRGSWLSFGNTPQSEPLRHSGMVDGIKNLYMTGQWFMPPGGLPGAAITGKWAVARIAANR